MKMFAGENVTSNGVESIFGNNLPNSQELEVTPDIYQEIYENESDHKNVEESEKNITKERNDISIKKLHEETQWIVMYGNHLDVNHDPNVDRRIPSICDLCRRSFNTQFALDDHFREHTANKNEKVKSTVNLVKCPHSKDTLETKELLGRNTNALQFAQKILICPHCSKEFNSERILQKHVISHTNKKQFSCNYCPETLVDNSDLQEHIYRHIDEKLCTMKDKFKETLVKSHNSTKKNEESNSFSCTYCNKCFTRRNKLTLHIRSHTGEKPFACKYCKKSFITRWKLQRHEKIHTGERPFVCYCRKGFISKDRLESHMKIHKKILPISADFSAVHPVSFGMFELKKEFCCEFCEKKFITRSTLRLHIRVHTGEKPFHCQHCDQCFISNHRLKTHELRMHSDIRPFGCHHCGKYFTLKELLKAHILTHLSIKPFCCEHCRKAFNTRYKLLLHIRTHTGEKPFSCNFCGKCFITRHKLTLHVRTHTGEKPYICTYCPKGFITSDKLREHIRTHTGEKPFACQYCDHRFNLKSGLQRHMVKHIEWYSYRQ